MVHHSGGHSKCPPGQDGSALLLAAGLFPLEEKPAKEHPLKCCAHVPHPLRDLHILIAVYVGVYLEADKT